MSVTNLRFRTSRIILLACLVFGTPGAGTFSFLTNLSLKTSTPTQSFTPTQYAIAGDFAPNEVLVRLDSSASTTDIQPCLADANASIGSEIAELGVLLLIVPFGKVAESITRLQNCKGVQYAEPNYVAQIADTIPNDPGWGNQYGLFNIRAPQGWDYTTGSTAIAIAILDTGVDLTHPDLASKIVPGYDFANNDNIPQDDNGHGTHVAGIAAAISNNGIGVAGVSWGARIMPIKVLNAAGSGSFANVAAGIVWAADNGAQVINLSLGGSSPSAVLQDAVNYAYGKGVTLVAATGNSGSNFVLYPARYPNVIAVAATDSSNTHAAFSNFGPEVDVAAPGVAIHSTTIGNNYGYLSGTSMAAPFVSGLAAILRGLPTNNSPDEITWKIETTALDLGTAGRDDLYGYGLIQLDTAVQSIWPTSTPTFISTATSTSLPIPTFTPTFPPTGTATSTSLPLPTFTPTNTVTATYTPTSTASPSFTFTMTPRPAQQDPTFTATVVPIPQKPYIPSRPSNTPVVVNFQAEGSATPSQTPIPATETATMTINNTALPETPQRKPEEKPTTIITPGFCLGLGLIFSGGCLMWCLISMRQGSRRKNPYTNHRYKK